VTVQRPDRVAGLGSSTPMGSAPLGSPAPLGSSVPLGQGDVVLGAASNRRAGWRAAQGAGVVVSGLMLGALALVSPGGTTAAPVVDEPRPSSVSGGSAGGGLSGAPWNVMRADFVRGGATRVSPTTTTIAALPR
jgi:hypothetical protein